MHKYILLSIYPLLSFLTPLKSIAYDFSAVNDDDKSIYYNIIADSGVEVTYCDAFIASESYTDRLTIPATVEHNGATYHVSGIAKRAFYNCASLTEIVLPETITTISDWAFAGCCNLESFNLPKGVQYIGNGIFDGCFALQDLSVDKNNQHFSSHANAIYNKNYTILHTVAPGQETKVTVLFRTKEIAHNAFYGCPYIKTITLNDELTTIGRNAFYFCNGLENIYIPKSVAEIQSGAFADCFSLSEIVVDTDNQYYSSLDGCLYDKAQARLIQSPGSKTGDAGIANTTESIGSKAFMRSYALTNINIPSSVETIEDAAFIDCANVYTVYIPGSVKEIGDMAFALCDNITTVYVAADSPEKIDMGEGVFAAATNPFRTLMVPLGSATLYSKSDKWSDFSLILEYENLLQQTIEWHTDQDIASADTLTINLSAEASSGLKVDYILSPESRGLAEIKGSTLKVIKGGDIYVTAIQNGNLQYAPATPVTHLIETPIVGITDAESDYAIKVYTRGSDIIIKGAADDDIVNIYDISGRLYYSGCDRIITARPHTLYIIRINSRSFKTLIP